MDLKELPDNPVFRHPWETARLKIIQQILAPHAFDGIKVLDLGCGDGFIANDIFKNVTAKYITAVDVHLTDELIKEVESLSNGIHFCQEIPENGFYDLILMLDMIEHIEDDRGFLANLVAKHVANGGKVLITVPCNGP